MSTRTISDNIDANFFSAQREKIKSVIDAGQTNILKAFSQVEGIPARTLCSWEEGGVVYVKAEILHLHYRDSPTPEELPRTSGREDEDANWGKINNFPTFVADSGVSQLGLPNPEKTIYVTFKNMNIDYIGDDEGIYLGLKNTDPREAPRGADRGLPPSSDSFPPDEPSPKLGDQLFPPPETTPTTLKLVPGVLYAPNRVRVFAFRPLPENSQLLRAPAGSRRKIHTLAAARFEAMNKAWVAKYPGKEPFKILGPKSGWRAHQWEHDRNKYRAGVIQEFKGHPDYVGLTDDEIFQKGSKDLAFYSPHETGLAFDIGNDGLTPNSNPEKGGISKSEQKNSTAFKWLKANAHRFGITPLKSEPWHWEVLVPRTNFLSGKEFSPGNYNVRVEETSQTPYPENVKDFKGRSLNVKGQKLRTNSKVFASNQFV